jgi:hypothetical protein
VKTEFLKVLEIWENPIKSHGYWHFGHGDFIFHNEPNVYLALILFFHTPITQPFPTNMTKGSLPITVYTVVHDGGRQYKSLE